MRHIIISIIATLMAMAASARQISPGEAQNIASDFFNNGSVPGKAPRSAIRVAARSSQTLTPQSYYIFNADNDAGFVIISGDDRARNILGYSDKGSFSAGKMPPQLEWLLSEYEKAIKTLPANAPSPRQYVSRSTGQTTLLSTQWGQSSPYNDKCPVVDGSRAVTGCVATAMAQVINYEKKSSRVAEIPEYWTDKVYMPNLPEYEFNFDNLDNDGIATLMLYCGQSVRMNYSPLESGAIVQDVPEALRKYFGWEQEVRFVERANFNDEHWNRMVKEEISAGHPILYSAVNESGGGHAFVIDGTSDDYFHVNWGWDGYMDGYFSFQPFGSDNQSEYILMQGMVTTRDDDPSADIITHGTTIDGINYQLDEASLSAMVLPLKNGEKYRGELIIPSHINHQGNTYTVSYFGPSAFVGCGHLESIFIPATIEKQEWSIFDGCDNLRKVDVEDMAAFIRLEVGGWWTGSPLWYGADLYLNGELVKDLVIPEGIETVGYSKFANCTSIESVKMPSTMKVVGQQSFYSCPNLKYVDMTQSSIEMIDISAFVNDVAIEEITLPSTLKTMCELAFSFNGPEHHMGLRKIVSLATTPPWSEHDRTFDDFQYSEAVVYVPDESVEKYRQAKEWSSFLDIRPLSEEKPLPELVKVSYDDLNYEINLTERYAKVIANYGCASECIVPYSVEYDGQSYPVEIIGFEGLSTRTVKRIDAELKKIGVASFCWANIENRLELPSTIETIPYRAFAQATIPYLVLPESISYIGKQAFGDDGVDIGDRARILEIESRNPCPPIISEDSFDHYIYDNASLKVPFGAMKAYADAPGWCNFKNVSNIGDEQEQVFDNDLTLSADIPNNLAVRDKMLLTAIGNVRNSGLQNISGFKLSWYIDEKYIDEKYFDVDLEKGGVCPFEEKIKVNVANAGTHELKLLVSIDGAADQDLSDNAVTISFESFDKGYYRVSLIEQFSTESCSLTPVLGPKIISGIENSGNSDFVAHVIHHCGFYDDFLTVNHDYEWFYSDYGTYTPAMMLNRTDISNTGCTPVNEVKDDIDRKIISEAGLCDALVSVYCDVYDGKVCVKTLLEKDEDFDLGSGYDYLTVFLVEDNIPAQAQLDGWSDGYAENYIHRNTMRKVLTNVWGNKIVWKDGICALKFESEIDASWNAENLKAVAFIHRYDPASPVNCQVYTANSSILPQYGIEPDDSLFEETSSIDNVMQNAERFDVYTVMGVKVKADATDFEGLPAGIYICNGKKVFVK